MAKLVADTGQYTNVAPVKQAEATMQLSPQAAEGSNVDYFNSLPAHVKPMVNAVLENRIPLAGKAPLDKKSMTQLFDIVTNVDPTYDATNFQKRQQTATAFAKGKQADAVRGANQALYHMGNLYQRAEDLGNVGFLPNIINPVVNYIEEKGFGDTRQGKFRQSAQAVASELRRVFAGAGGGSLAELNKWENSLPENASEEQQKAYIQNGLDLLKGGLDALNAQYQAGMGLNRDVSDLLSPKARGVYNALEQGKNPNEPKTKAQKQGAILKSGNIPAGITAAEWAAMSPEDKKLWQN
jgi:hypothetical protein